MENISVIELLLHAVFLPLFLLWQNLMIDFGDELVKTLVDFFFRDPNETIQVLKKLSLEALIITKCFKFH